MRDMYHGIFTPLITPLTAEDRIDLPSMRRLVAFQLENEVHGLWAMGTTSEFAAFDEDERAAAIETVIEAAEGRVPVIANVSDAATRLALRHARRAQAAGANAIAATPPYYYPHTQDEVLAHFRAIREAVPLPLFIYNIPQTVRVRVDLPTAQTLAAAGVVDGIKDSQNDLEYFRRLALFVREERLSFALFAGTRLLIDAAILAGGDGAIPNIANAYPDLCVAAYRLATAGKYREAAAVEDGITAIENVVGSLQEGSRNAATVGFLKNVLFRRGIISSPAVTSPLRTMTAEEAERALKRVPMPEGAR